jgi:iron complex outermembrane recepter protein
MICTLKRRFEVRILLLLIAIHAAGTSCFHAQQAADTGLRVICLQEVCISDGSDSANIAFNFYQAGKLAGTEDLLSRMSGVSLIRRGAFGLEPVLRNYSAGQINMTIDGMRIYGACTDRMDPVSIYIEPVNLRSIQAGHGSAASLMGSTIGGQINFQLKEPDTSCHKKISGQLSQSWASNNGAIHSSGWIQRSGGKLSIRAGGIYRKAGNYLAAERKEIPWSGYEKANFSTVMLYQIDSRQSIRLDMIYDIGRNIGFPALPMDVGKATALIGSLSHRIILKRGLLKSVNSRIYGNQIIHSMDDTNRDDVLMHMDMPGKTTTLGFYSELHLRNGLQIRVDGHQAEALAEMTMYPDNEPQMYVQTLPLNRTSNAGISAFKDFKLKARQVIRLITRLDHYQIRALDGPGVPQWEVFGADILQVKQEWLKTLNVSWEKTFEGQWFSRISAGYGERIPTAAELFGYYLYNRQDQSDYLGNIQLNPESSLQIEWLGRKDLKKGLVQVNLFAHRIQQYIYAIPVIGIGPATPGALGLKSYSNIPFAMNLGFEFTGKYRPTEAIDYLATVKYVYAETNQQEPLPLVPPLKLQQALAFKLGGFQFQAEHDFAMAQNRINIHFGDRATASFHLINFRIARNFNIGKAILQAGAACENIMDLNYREHLDIGTIPRPGRNFSFNVSYRF